MVFSRDVAKRVGEHSKGKVKTTKRFLPLEILGFKEFETKIEALNFEKN